MNEEDKNSWYTPEGTHKRICPLTFGKGSPSFCWTTGCAMWRYIKGTDFEYGYCGLGGKV